MQKFTAKLGTNLRDARDLRELTQEDLAALTDISQETISRIETGYNTNPSLETVLILCHALGMELQEVVYHEFRKKKVVQSRKKRA